MSIFAHPTSGFDIVLYSPRIPQNVGSIGRICAATRTPLHVIRPIPFSLSDASLQRTAMDYWDHVKLAVHDDWRKFRETTRGRRVWLLTRHGDRTLYDVSFRRGDCILFGNESHGISDLIREELGADRALTIPMLEPDTRSLNLSVAAGIALYEAMRQTMMATVDHSH